MIQFFTWKDTSSIPVGVGGKRPRGFTVGG